MKLIIENNSEHKISITKGLDILSNYFGYSTRTLRKKIYDLGSLSYNESDLSFSIKKKEQKKYNGWKNYKTWNIALWINNDSGLYYIAKECKNYNQFIKELEELEIYKTNDNVRFKDREISKNEINQVIKDIK